MTIVRMVHFTAVLTIVFLMKAGKCRFSMMSLYEAFPIVRIILLNPEMMMNHGLPIMVDHPLCHAD